MSDIVNSRVLENGSKRYVIKLTNESDGTGETKVKKVDLTDLTLEDGANPTSVAIESIEYSVAGFNYVTLYWDRDTDQVAEVLFGVGGFDYTKWGGLHDPEKDEALGPNSTGDILLSTDAPADGDSYNIILSLRLER
jgi:hypothetical protein